MSESPAVATFVPPLNQTAPNSPPNLDSAAPVSASLTPLSYGDLLQWFSCDEKARTLYADREILGLLSERLGLLIEELRVAEPESARESAPATLPVAAPERTFPAAAAAVASPDAASGDIPVLTPKQRAALDASSRLAALFPAITRLSDLSRDRSLLNLAQKLLAALKAHHADSYKPAESDSAQPVESEMVAPQSSKEREAFSASAVVVRRSLDDLLKFYDSIKREDEQFTFLRVFDSGSSLTEQSLLLKEHVKQTSRNLGKFLHCIALEVKRNGPVPGRGHA